ncbi:hypothetical protein AMIS_4190 [Actinoplanes missouriensis 431]|uniref:Uncharacterized protein n=1 Tax=Actinoplanes missouriensis (strain ATCC 14538 / DSM 43046 / CBS 188.64 / JCM 3121 / NBRC 102363 / NCIMB 12654 / NRRL B-3342 / UNCC 431) TaxID=512565 RepID=I0GY02_ACTM4|nr:hypothetical protein [Actinoplanes missouriensis]BAL85639.1 hypothetical protein AMIS_4190 [Actinoplanes missouriensis 431]
MHHGNHFYGHAHVLAEYCGLDPADPPRIDGYLQHGWNVVDGLGAGTPYAPGRPIFVWSERTRRRAWSMNRPMATVIGSPFLYLLNSLADDEQPEDGQQPERDGTIWYPFHGWEGQKVDGDHRRLIDEIVATEPGPITFCLYWHEYSDARIRAAYERAGRVICHGYRGYMRMRTDTRFLHKQLAELRRHKRVASNRLSSAVFYGVAAGCEPAVYGNPMQLAKEDAPTAERIRREWAELHGTAPDPGTARRIALAELGDGYLASPAELRATLGWTTGDQR